MNYTLLIFACAVAGIVPGILLYLYPKKTWIKFIAGAIVGGSIAEISNRLEPYFSDIWAFLIPLAIIALFQMATMLILNKARPNKSSKG